MIGTSFLPAPTLPSSTSCLLGTIPSPEMKLVKVDEYDIVIGRNLDIAKKALELVPNAAVYVVVTDDNINNLYGEAIRNNFSGHGAKVLFKALPPGEISKSRQGKAEIEDWMFENHCNRDTCLIAIGGGVIGDLVGYVAATFMRGIPYIQVPTTVLAMVDSSVGGKTAIDAPAGKNLIGAFYKPVSVLCDLDFVKTLPKRELSNGLAEAIKAGAIKSAELFEFFESNVEGLMSKDVDLLSEVVAAAVQIKADVVREDFKEGGLRAILNFGHSIGHAIEHYMQPGMLHGECISIGMIEEAVLARSLGYLQSSHIRRLESVLKAYGLPTTVPHGLTVSMILKAMAIDKKNKRGKKMIVMLTSIGSVHLCPSYTVAVSDTALAKTLCDAASVLPGTAMGTVAVPGSKSISNRVLLLAAMGLGPCRITGLLHSQDTQVMLTSLKQLGVAYEWENHEKTLLVHGCGGRIHPPSKELWLHNAGTAARFLTSLVATLHSGEATLTGNKRMQERPVKDLIDALRTCACFPVVYVVSYYIC
jgi:pentafunctional AROM polypeptide